MRNECNNKTHKGPDIHEFTQADFMMIGWWLYGIQLWVGVERMKWKIGGNHLYDLELTVHFLSSSNSEFLFS